MTEKLSNIVKYSPDDFQALMLKLKGEENESREAGSKLVKLAAKFGLTVKQYLQLSVDRTSADDLDGYEKALMALNLPIRNNFADGIHLEMAADTFQTYPGTRALFPEVVDDILRYENRQDEYETTANMVAGSRTITGNEMIRTVVPDDSESLGTFYVAEGANIPVRSIRTTQTSVSFFKHGSGLRTTYEFDRSASIDIVVPHMRRIARELEISKVRAATDILINGEGVTDGNPASPSVDQSSFDATTGATATDGEISWKHLLAWLVERAKVGTPVDTVLMNWDGWFQWLLMFAVPGAVDGPSGGELLNRSGQPAGSGLNIFTAITPVLSSSPSLAGKLLGYTRGDTVEELIQGRSDVAETESNIRNQTILLTKTQNAGYSLLYGDTRSIYNFAA